MHYITGIAFEKITYFENYLHHIVILNLISSFHPN